MLNSGMPKNTTEPVVSTVPQEEDHDSRRPKRVMVGTVDGVEVHQLLEPTGCLDCFKSMPAGSLVTIKHVSSKYCKIPVCPYFSGDRMEHLKLKGAPITPHRECSCPAFADGTVKSREDYSARIRKMREEE